MKIKNSNLKPCTKYLKIRTSRWKFVANGSKLAARQRYKVNKQMIL